MNFEPFLADLTLPWEVGVPVIMAIAGLIAWLVRKITADHEGSLRAAHRRIDAHEKALYGVEKNMEVLGTEFRLFRTETRDSLHRVENLIRGPNRNDNRTD